LARFHARRFQPFRNAVGTQGAFVDLLRAWIEFRNIEWASRNAVAATDAIRLLEIDNTVVVLHNRAVRRTRRQTARIGAMHAAILAHQPHERPVVALVFVEFDQVPVVPARFGHRLVRVVELRLAKR
jgi:hypothetical protein